MSLDELIPIYTNLFDIIRSDVLPQRAVSLAFTAFVCELIQNIT